MIFCTNCGGNIEDGVKFCSKCGKAVSVFNESNTQVHEQQFIHTVDKKGQAITSLVLGLVGIIAWFLPLLGFPVSIIGLIMGVIGQKSTKKNMATVGLVLSIICLVATIINASIGAYLGCTGQHPLF